MPELLKLKDYPHQDYDKLRYSDMDAQGHVNNAVITTLLESGRTSLLDQPGIDPWNQRQYAYVIARLEVDYRVELLWPGLVHIGTAVKSIGKSSAVLLQALFQNDVCAVTAQCVVVQVNRTTHRPEPVSPEIRAALTQLMVKPPSS